MPSFFTESRKSEGKQMEKALLEQWYWETVGGGDTKGSVFERYYDCCLPEYLSKRTFHVGPPVKWREITGNPDKQGVVANLKKKK